MKISLNWIKKYTDVDISTEELVKLATERLGGIEGVTDYGKHFDGIVVAKVISCVKHGNADKLNVCKVDDGSVVKDVERDENGYVQVVCGAPNVREGLLVAWIPPSAVVPASYGEKELFVLEARDLRGELSNGMLASPAELGMSDDHSGILEIEEDAQPGTPFKQLYDLDDTIIEIENKMFTHRPDGFGHLGVAREVAGIQHNAFKSPDWYVNAELPEGDSSNISVSIEDSELSPRYMAVEFENIEIKPSPLWLQSYLKRVGIKPINVVVDITNYVMMEAAQPLHAFDFDKVAVSGTVEISVRKPKEGEKLLLLDGKTIEPHKEATLICNSNGPIALGGVMGGGNSEIDQNTKRVVLECATFNMYNVRKTSMIHGLFTDAATRLTKGQPAGQLPSVLVRAIMLFEEIAGAKVVGGVVDAYPANGQTKKDMDYIEVEPKFINDRLGSKFTAEEIVKILTNVEIGAHEASGPISVTAPFWRTDLEIPEDIVEEVGRLYGFNQLPIQLPQRSIAPVAPEQMRTLKAELRSALARAGANEVLTYSFVHGDLLKKADQDTEQAFALRNALSPDLQYYRLSILPSLLDKVRGNVKAGYDEFTLFEIGKGHNKSVIDEETGLPDEISNLEMVYTNARPQSGAPYFQMLKTVDYTLKQLGIAYKLQPVDNDGVHQALKPFDLSRSAYIMNATNRGGMIGFVGELKPSVIKAFKLPEYTAAASFAIDGPSFYPENRNLNGIYKALSRYQSTSQDLTLKVMQEIQFDAVKTLLESELEKTDYDTNLVPLGVYQKEGSDSKNMSFRVTLSHQDRTLTTSEVTKLIDSIAWSAHEAFEAEQV